MWQKAKNAGDSLVSCAPARKFALAFAPPLVAGVVLTALFYFKSLFAFMPTVWLTLYGTAVVTGGAYSVKIVPIVGWMFILLGLVSAFFDESYNNYVDGVRIRSFANSFRIDRGEKTRRMIRFGIWDFGWRI